MKKYIGIVAVALVLYGCGGQTVERKPITLHHTFDKEKAEQLLQKGNNTIMGSALLRQNGGGVVTCAGYEVSLVPYTAYANERIFYLYGNSVKGFNPRINQYNAVVFDPLSVDSEYPIFRKKTICDAQGKFSFKNVADGSFFIATSVIWQVGYTYQGGNLMQLVTVKNGEVKEIVLTP